MLSGAVCWQLWFITPHMMDEVHMRITGGTIQINNQCKSHNLKRKFCPQIEKKLFLINMNWSLDEKQNLQMTEGFVYRKSDDPVLSF